MLELINLTLDINTGQILPLNCEKRGEFVENCEGIIDTLNNYLHCPWLRNMINVSAGSPKLDLLDDVNSFLCCLPVAPLIVMHECDLVYNV